MVYTAQPTTQRSMYNVYNVHVLFLWNPWTMSMNPMDNVHGLFPWTPWKKSMDILEKKSWIFSMDSLEIVLHFRSNTPARHCPWMPWILSTDSMDFLQTGTESPHLAQANFKKMLDNIQLALLDRWLG